MFPGLLSARLRTLLYALPSALSCRVLSHFFLLKFVHVRDAFGYVAIMVGMV